MEKKQQSSSGSIHQDLLATQSLVYSPNKFECSIPVEETESSEYGAYSFTLNGYYSIRFRVSKITPTKIGQFVTLWKRIGCGPIQPFDISDSVDFFVISTRKENHFGQFVFPKSVLIEHDILSVKGKGGKRGIRIYPPWDRTTSRQAEKTQIWQLKYFLEIPQNKSVDAVRCLSLYALK